MPSYRMSVGICHPTMTWMVRKYKPSPPHRSRWLSPSGQESLELRLVILLVGMDQPLPSICSLQLAIVVTGFFPACLHERLASIHPPASHLNYTDLRRCRSFSYGRSAAAYFEPQHHSYHAPSALFHQKLLKKGSWRSGRNGGGGSATADDGGVDADGNHAAQLTIEEPGEHDRGHGHHPGLLPPPPLRAQGHHAPYPGDDARDPDGA